MPNPTLDADDLRQVNRLLKLTRQRIDRLADGDAARRFAFRRKVWKELVYDERSKPMVRRRLKKLMWEKQKRLCAMCKKRLLLAYSELDRKQASAGYVEANVRLVHAKCHHRDQARKAYV